MVLMKALVGAIFIGFDGCAYSLQSAAACFTGWLFWNGEATRNDSAVQAIWFGTDTSVLPADRVDRSAADLISPRFFPLWWRATTVGAEKASLLFDGTV